MIVESKAPPAGPAPTGRSGDGRGAVAPFPSRDLVNVIADSVPDLCPEAAS